MGSAAKYWLLLGCLLATIYGSFLLWRRDQQTHPNAPQGASETAPQVTTARVGDKPAKEPDATVREFELTDQDGRPFDSRSLRGKVWVGSFFFTNCPAICWRLNQTLAAIQETHPDSDVRFVSITCDPANDTPEALARYAAHFKADPARWTFLTGDMDEIRSIGNESFKVAVETSTHSDRAFVVDRQGKVRGRFRLTEPNQVAMLEKLLEVVEAEPVVSDSDDAPPAGGNDATATEDASPAETESPSDGS